MIARKKSSDLPSRGGEGMPPKKLSEFQKEEKERILLSTAPVHSTLGHRSRLGDDTLEVSLL